MKCFLFDLLEVQLPIKKSMNTEQNMSVAATSCAATSFKKMCPACAGIGNELTPLEKREMAMREIMEMRYVPFIQALKSDGLPDFEREKKPEIDFSFDIEEENKYDGLVQRATRQYAYDACSPELASQNRGELRYMTVAEFLEEFPCTMKLTRGDYEFDENLKKMQEQFNRSI